MQTKDHDASCHQTFDYQFSPAQRQTNQLSPHTLIRRKEVPQERHRQGARVHRWREELYVIVRRRKRSTDVDVPLPRATQYGQILIRLLVTVHYRRSVVSHMREEATDPSVQRCPHDCCSKKRSRNTRQQARFPWSQPCVTGAVMNMMSTKTRSPTRKVPVLRKANQTPVEVRDQAQADSDPASLESQTHGG